MRYSLFDVVDISLTAVVCALCIALFPDISHTAQFILGVATGATATRVVLKMVYRSFMSDRSDNR